jgi:hypothetical protein
MKKLLKTNVFFYLVPTLLLWGFCLNTFAQSPINCHCFKNRYYQPADRFAADDYILATSFNSLLAKSFGISKREIIMLKMQQRVPQDELMIGLKVAKITGGDVNKLLDLRRTDKTWQEIIGGVSQQDKIGSDSLLESIISGMPVDQAGDGIADEIIAQLYTVTAEEINKLRKAGLNEKEIALLFILVHVKDQKQETLLEQRSELGKSWSEIAHDLGIEPTAAGKLILAYPAKQITE